MTERLWTDGTPGSVLALTDEKALDLLQAGRNIRPLQGAANLTATLHQEVAAWHGLILAATVDIIHEAELGGADFILGPFGTSHAWLNLSCTYCQHEGHRESGCPTALDHEREQTWKYRYEL